MSKAMIEKVICAVCSEVLHNRIDCEEAVNKVCANMHIILSTKERQALIHTVVYRVII